MLSPMFIEKLGTGSLNFPLPFSISYPSTISCNLRELVFLIIKQVEGGGGEYLNQLCSGFIHNNVLGSVNWENIIF